MNGHWVLEVENKRGQKVHRVECAGARETRKALLGAMQGEAPTHEMPRELRYGIWWERKKDETMKKEA